MKELEPNRAECASVMPELSVRGEHPPVKSVVNLSDKLIFAAERNVLELLEKGYDAVCRLALMRTECKRSNARAAGVARELKELIKVLSASVPSGEKAVY